MVLEYQLRRNKDPSDAFTESYTFDAAGNLTLGGTRTYVYDQNRLAQTKIGTEVQTYFFFDTGKRWRTVQAPTSSETDPDRTTYAYTGTGRLSEFKRYSGGSVAAQGTYQYDSVGQRTRSTVTAGGIQTTTDFTYTGLTLHKLEAEEKQGETTLAKWSITYLYDEYGRPYAGIYRDTTDPENPAAPVTFALVTTDRGDVVELLDANGKAFAAYRYDAWGNPIGAGNVGTGLWAQATSQSETETISLDVAEKIAQRQVLRYAGYCYDSESGMYYLSARHYDPVTRQFLSKDLSRNDGEQSAYGYCAGNPVANVDPTGYSLETIQAALKRFVRELWLMSLKRALEARKWLSPYAKRNMYKNGVYDTRKMDLKYPASVENSMVSEDPGDQLHSWIMEGRSGAPIERWGTPRQKDQRAKSRAQALYCVVIRDGVVYQPREFPLVYAAATGVIPGIVHPSDDMVFNTKRDENGGGAYIREEYTTGYKAGYCWEGPGEAVEGFLQGASDAAPPPWNIASSIGSTLVGEFNNWVAPHEPVPVYYPGWIYRAPE